jgi:hypothetical protein
MADAIQHETVALGPERLPADLSLSSGRVVEVLDGIADHSVLGAMPSGLFSACTGATVARVAAAERPAQGATVVWHGGCPDLARLVMVSGANHLFEEPGALDAMAELAASWFTRHLDAGGGTR